MFGTAQLPKFKDDQFSAVSGKFYASLRTKNSRSSARCDAQARDGEQAFDAIKSARYGLSPPPKCR